MKMFHPYRSALVLLLLSTAAFAATLTAPTKVIDSPDQATGKTTNHPWKPTDNDTTWKPVPLDPTTGLPKQLGSALDPLVTPSGATVSIEPRVRNPGGGADLKPDRISISSPTHNVDFQVPWEEVRAQPPGSPVEAPVIGSPCEGDPPRVVRTFARVSGEEAVYVKITANWIIINTTQKWTVTTDTYKCVEGRWRKTDSRGPNPAGYTARSSRFAISRPAR